MQKLIIAINTVARFPFVSVFLCLSRFHISIQQECILVITIEEEHRDLRMTHMWPCSMNNIAALISHCLDGRSRGLSILAGKLNTISAEASRYYCHSMKMNGYCCEVECSEFIWYGYWVLQWSHNFLLIAVNETCCMNQNKAFMVALSSLHTVYISDCGKIVMNQPANLIEMTANGRLFKSLYNR